MLDRLMFDNLFLYQFVDGIVRAFASVLPHIFDVVIISAVFKGNIFEFIGRRLTKNWMVLYDSYQDWFELVAVYKAYMPHINVMKKFQWE